MREACDVCQREGLCGWEDRCEDVDKEGRGGEEGEKGMPDRDKAEGGGDDDKTERRRKTVQVKASGGIRTFEDVRRMVAAGAARIGASAGVAILEGAREAEQARRMGEGGGEGGGGAGGGGDDDDGGGGGGY
jgi:hypothetical protein